MNSLSITSLKNPKIKQLIGLQKLKERKSQQLFSIEGVREISLAQQAGFEFESIFFCESIYSKDVNYPVNACANCNTYAITKELFEKVAYRESTGGIIAIARYKSTSLEYLEVHESPLYLVLEKVEKPGNIGAMLRTADAAGLSGVIICDPATDFFNPNVIRSSIGCVFTVPVASTTNETLKDWLIENKIKSFATLLTSNNNYTESNYRNGSAFLLGSESSGLSTFWQKNADEHIVIPMLGKIDSMNVSNAAAVVIYEALRQRNFRQ